MSRALRRCTAMILGLLLSLSGLAATPAAPARIKFAGSGPGAGFALFATPLCGTY